VGILHDLEAQGAEPVVLWSLEDGGAVGKGVVGGGGCHHRKIRRASLAEYVVL
jgi:hypothetical protein